MHMYPYMHVYNIILWATPSAAGLWPLLIVLRLQILGIFGNGSQIFVPKLVIRHAQHLHSRVTGYPRTILGH